jgi:hypothetical protein
LGIEIAGRELDVVIEVLPVGFYGYGCFAENDYGYYDKDKKEEEYHTVWILILQILEILLG